MAAHLSQEAQIFFIYDHTVLQKEEDDLIDAIVFFYPSSIDVNSQCALCGQLMGMVGFFKALTGAPPELFRLQNDKFAVRHLGRFTFALAANSGESDASLLRQLNNLMCIFRFFQGSLDILRSLSPSDGAFISAIKAIWECYLPFTRHYGDTLGTAFDSILTVQLPKSASNLFLRASHLLQASQRRPGVIAGCLLYKNKVLITQLQPEITARLLVIRPQQSHLPCHLIDTEFELPKGVRIMSVYLSDNEFGRMFPQYYKVRRRHYVTSDFRKNNFSDLRYSTGVDTYRTSSSDTAMSSPELGVTGDTPNTPMAPTASTPVIERQLSVSSSVQTDIESPQDENFETGARISPVMVEDTDKVETSPQEGATTSAQTGSEPPQDISCISHISPHSMQNTTVYNTTNNETITDNDSGANLTQNKLSFLSTSNVSLDTSAGVPAIMSRSMTSASMNSSLASMEESSTSPLREQTTQVVFDIGSNKGDSEHSDQKEASVESVNGKCVNNECGDAITESTQESDKENLAEGEQVTPPVKEGEAGTVEGEVKENMSVTSGCESEKNHGSSNTQIVPSCDTETMCNTRDQNQDKINKDECNGHNDVKHVLNKNEDNKSVLKPITKSNSAQTIKSDVPIKRPTSLNGLIGKSNIETISTDCSLNSTGKDVLWKGARPKTKNNTRKIADQIISQSQTDNSGKNSKSKDKSETTSVPSVDKKSGGSISSLPEKFSAATLDSMEVPGLENVTLYVQGHSEMVLLLLMERGARTDEAGIKAVWRYALPQLADLEVQIKESLMKVSGQQTDSGYNYLHFDNYQKKLTGNCLSPMSGHDNEFCNKAFLLHEEFLESDTLRDITLRTHSSCMYAHSSFHQETFYQSQSILKPSPGFPAPVDSLVNLEGVAKKNLSEKHGITIL